MRPNLTLEIPIPPSPCARGNDGLVLRRTGSWEEGSLADSCDVRVGLSDDEVARAHAWVAMLNDMDIKLLCLDFDLTLVSMHTGGRWWGNTKTLERSVRQLFRVIIPECHRRGIEVCVVTMSSQTKLVADVLRASVPCDMSQVLVRGGERTLMTEEGEVDGATELEGARKQRHINSVLHKRRELGKSPLLSHQVLLVDDDHFNVDEALTQGMRALVFNPDSPLQLCVGVDIACSFDLEKMNWD